MVLFMDYETGLLEMDNLTKDFVILHVSFIQRKLLTKTYLK